MLSGDFNFNFILPKAEPLIAFRNYELKLEMNTNQNVSTANSGTVIAAVFQRFLNTLKSQVYVSYFSYRVTLQNACLLLCSSGPSLTCLRTRVICACPLEESIWERKGN
ncbi:hypothetical protein TNCV_561131 [Trichonephila clavipes]|uniref:Uncharacterized protein n=1 Tax=Trichonephila clavipes TaxID=2585209 RepID=A0A8X6S3A2_TRICX|nr:hypothetical protein TNCV_561131 [Trichonephila clavipes]